MGYVIKVNRNCVQLVKLYRLDSYLEKFVLDKLVVRLKDDRSQFLLWRCRWLHSLSIVVCYTVDAAFLIGLINLSGYDLF